jgi:hypothetical protein
VAARCSKRRSPPRQPVGRILFQPRIRSTNGRVDRLDTRLGRGFAIVGRTHDDLRVGAEAQQLLERLNVQKVALDELEVVEGELDPVFGTYPAVVVRPDRLIFGVVDEQYDLDWLLEELARKLSLNAR